VADAGSRTKIDEYFHSIQKNLENRIRRSRKHNTDTEAKALRWTDCRWSRRTISTTKQPDLSAWDNRLVRWEIRRSWCHLPQLRSVTVAGWLRTTAPSNGVFWTDRKMHVAV